MNDKQKNKVFFCKGCEEYVDKIKEIDSYKLCEHCFSNYLENGDKTGYCSLDCCLGYGCDETC